MSAPLPSKTPGSPRPNAKNVSRPLAFDGDSFKKAPMNKLCTHGFRLVAFFSLLMLAVSRSMGAQMPEFGSSVQFDKAGPEITLSQFRGKAVLIVFFQTDYYIVKEWFQQMEEAYGDERALVMMLIKTDRRGLPGAPGAIAYLKDRGLDFNKWCVGSDEGAAYFKKVTGKESATWTYYLLDGAGNVVEQDYPGGYTTTEDNKYKFSLPAKKNLLKKCGKVDSFLPYETVYPPEQAKIVHFAETGSMGKALAMCTTPAQKTLRQDILTAADKRITQRMEVLKDPAKDNATHYEAYKDLIVMVRDCPTAFMVKEASAVLAAANANAAIQKEKNAEIAYIAAMQKLQKAGKADRVKCLKELEYTGKRYEGTKYGELCIKESQAVP